MSPDPTTTAALSLLLKTIGPEAARYVARRVFRATEIDGATQVTIDELIAASSGNPLIRRKARRHFEQIAEAVALSLAPYFTVEHSGLSSNEVEATANAVARLLEDARISLDDLVDLALSAERLEALIMEQAPAGIDRDLSPAATVLFEFARREACNYIIEIATSLGSYEIARDRQFFEQLGDIHAILLQVFERLPEPGMHLAPGSDASFSLQYRRALLRHLDWLQLFGVDAPAARRRYELTTAYISLEADVSGTHADGSDGDDPATEADSSIESLAKSQGRLLLRGDAGSGKTTLLSWLAIQTARTNPTADDATAEPLVPFFIRLRQFQGQLPTPEEFVAALVPNLAAEQPPGWARSLLRSGGALVLIDGVDEVTEAQRRTCRDWLLELVSLFPDARYCVTSRPAAVTDDWLADAGFVTADVLPMSSAQVTEFVEKWHSAQMNLASDESGPVDDSRKERLLGSLSTHSGLRALATNPLMCALLCALNWERRGNLPQNRMQVYQVALEMLLVRRDEERTVPDASRSKLTLPEWLVLLQDLAQWLTLAGASDAPQDAARARLKDRLATFTRGPYQVDAVMDYLILRSGLLREPVEGRIDFIHRTFQEYLAAREFINREETGVLLSHAEDPQWRETIALAAGHANRRQRQELVEGLLAAGDAGTSERQASQLLAVACLETMTDLERSLQHQVARTLDTLVPPRNLSQARDLASAGDLAVPHLRQHLESRPYVATGVPTVRALSLIGTDEALSALTTLRRERRRTMVRELVRAWDSFDLDEYARGVLGSGGPSSLTLPIRIDSLAKLEAARYAKALQNLVIDLPRGRPAPPENLAALEHVQTLRIRSADHLTDLQWASGLTRLRTLDLSDATGLVSVRGVPAHLLSLTLDEASALEDLSDLWGPALQVLALQGDSLPDLSGLATSVASLRELRLQGNGLFDAGILRGAPQLATLWLSDVRVTDFAALGSCPALRHVELDEPQLEARDEWRKLTQIQRLSLRAFDEVDLSLVGELSALRHLTLDGCELVGIAPSRTLNGLVVMDVDSIEDLQSLRGLHAVYVSLGRMHRLTSLEGLEENTRLRRLVLNRCPVLSDVSALERLAGQELEVRMMGLAPHQVAALRESLGVGSTD